METSSVVQGTVPAKLQIVLIQYTNDNSYSTKTYICTVT